MQSEKLFQNSTKIVRHIAVNSMLSTTSLSQPGLGQAWDSSGTDDEPVIFGKNRATVGQKGRDRQGLCLQ
jgi:hypothetical protein